MKQHNIVDIKRINPIYTTFKGGYDTYNENMTNWSYIFLWGYLRFCYNEDDLIDGWTHITIHGYKNGYTYTPIKLKWWNFNWHIAVRKKWPFIKIGIRNICPKLLYPKLLYKGE
jgi:hypothetical protein